MEIKTFKKIISILLYMSFETLSEKYDFRKIKTNYTYNNSKLRIMEIKRQDGEHMSRKSVIKLCDSFQAE